MRLKVIYVQAVLNVWIRRCWANKPPLPPLHMSLLDSVQNTRSKLDWRLKLFSLSAKLFSATSLAWLRVLYKVPECRDCALTPVWSVWLRFFWCVWLVRGRRHSLWPCSLLRALELESQLHSSEPLQGKHNTHTHTKHTTRQNTPYFTPIIFF